MLTDAEWMRKISVDPSFAERIDRICNKLKLVEDDGMKWFELRWTINGKESIYVVIAESIGDVFRNFQNWAVKNIQAGTVVHITIEEVTRASWVDSKPQPV